MDKKRTLAQLSRDQAQCWLRTDLQTDLTNCKWLGSNSRLGVDPDAAKGLLKARSHTAFFLIVTAFFGHFWLRFVHFVHMMRFYVDAIAIAVFFVLLQILS